MAAKPEAVDVDLEEGPAEPVPAGYMKDSEWISAHLTELTEQFPDEWIAVVDGRVVAAGKDAGAVQREARAKTDRWNFPMRLLQTGPWPWHGRA